MKKTVLRSLTGLVLFFNTQFITACDYNMWISSTECYDPTASYTLYLNDAESISIYAMYGYGLISYFQDDKVELIWEKDGIPFKTTNKSNTHYCNTPYTSLYVTTINITEPGTYSVIYYTPNNVPMNGGSILVLEKSPAIEAETTSPELDGPDVANMNEAMNVYPNPCTDGYLYIDYGVSRYTNNHIEILNESGMIISSIVPDESGIITLNTTAYKKGLYFIRINRDDLVITKKVIIS